MNFIKKNGSFLKIYTRQGDQGFTRLRDGRKVSKADIEIKTLGDIDELSSCIGIARAFIKKNNETFSSSILKELQQMDLQCRQIQENLVLAGSIISTIPEAGKEDSQSLKMNNQMIQGLEKNIDDITEKLPIVKNFILPAGFVIATQLHLARTICRRAERSLVELSQNKNVDKTCLIYFNRLADLLFQMARYVNFLIEEEN